MFHAIPHSAPKLPLELNQSERNAGMNLAHFILRRGRADRTEREARRDGGMCGDEDATTAEERKL